MRKETSLIGSAVGATIIPAISLLEIEHAQTKEATDLFTRFQSNERSNVATQEEYSLGNDP